MTTAQLPKRSSINPLDLNTLFDDSYPAHFYGHFGMFVESTNKSSDSKLNYAQKNYRIEQRLKVTCNRYKAKNRIKSVIEHKGVKVTVIATGIHRSILVESTKDNFLYQKMLTHMQNIKPESYKGSRYNCVTVVAELLEILQPKMIIDNSKNWTIPWLLDRRIHPNTIAKRSSKNTAQLGFHMNRSRSNDSLPMNLKEIAARVTAAQPAPAA